MSPVASCDAVEDAQLAVEESQKNLTNSRNNFKVTLETFILTFLAEWGDRTQIATITLAASNNVFGVTAGAILGHIICAIIAVLGGKLIASRISERMVTIIGGFLFLVFAVVAIVRGV